MSVWEIDRRDMLAQLLMLVGAPITTASLSACEGRRLNGEQAGQFFDADAMAILTDVIDLMLPRTDTIGAVDVGVPAFVDGLMTDWAGPTARARVTGVLTDVADVARAQSGRPYPSLDRNGRLDALTALDARSFQLADARADGYRLFKKIVFLAYATSPQVLTDYVPNPGPYRGDLNRAEFDRLVAERSDGAR